MSGTRVNQVSELSYLHIPPAAQKEGLAKRLLQNQLALHDHLGTTRIDLNANIDVGGYAWARYGFKPQSAGWWRMLRDGELSDRVRILKNTPAIFSSQEGQAVLTELNRLLKSNSPDSIRQVAAMDFRVPSADGASLIPLGKRLLLGTDWFGEITLTNPADYSILHNYIHQ